MINLTVIMPFIGNNLNFLSYALNSLRLQTYSNFNVFFIDSSESEDAYNLLKLYMNNDNRFKYFKSPFKQLASSLNIGIKNSRSKYIARFDSDDICHPKRFEKQISYLEDNEKIDILGSNATLIDKNGIITGIKRVPSDHYDIKKYFYYRNAIIHPSVIIRRSSLNNFLYRNDFLYAEDLELWLRLLKNNLTFANLDESLIFYRKIKKFRCLNNWIFNLKARKSNISIYFK